MFAAEEDFGIIPVEAQARGTPVIAYGAGGALETVIDYEQNPQKATGIFFNEQTPDDLADALARFDKVSAKIKPKNCRKNAEKFAPEVFRNELIKTVQNAIKQK